MIYTSGSTGKPKGVMIQHKALVNFSFTQEIDRKLALGTKVGLYVNFTFDTSVGAFCPGLLFGSQIHVICSDMQKDLNLLDDYISEKELDIIEFPTQAGAIYYDTFKESHLKRLVTGGEKLNIREWEERNYLFVDEYGPTENTVTSTVKYINSIEDTNSIGRPLGNIKVYIVDSSDHLCPIGVPGEICLSGRQLAKGYWKRQELTNEKFVINPFNLNEDSHCKYMYRTGDLACWLPNGEIQFLGRVDYQVKIRGFRIELGEIESALIKIESIKEAVVVTRKDSFNHQFLVGYYVSDNNLEDEQLRLLLKRILPDYMIPQYLISLDEMPLNNNGKIDRKALPEPVIKNDNFVPARNETEHLLVTLWAQILGIDEDRIGIDDNYFHLGGDSIKAIQLISHVKKYSFAIKAKDLFANPTIRELAAVINENIKDEIIIDQGLQTGNFALLPIQKWFFEQQFTYYNYWTQSVLVTCNQTIEEHRLEIAVDQLLLNHDALRLRFYKDDVNNWRQVYGDANISNQIIFEKIHIAEDKNEKAILKHISSCCQEKFDIEQGPIMCIALIHGYEDGKDRILIVAHHLVIDGVSWRILVRDLQSIYESEVVFDKTHSFKVWVETVEKYGTELSKEEKNYWSIVNSRVKNSLKGMEKDNTYRSNKLLKLNFDTTKKLLQKSNFAYNTQINDLLLTALSLSLYGWKNNADIVINLEGHGREDIDQNIDISNTVGWFTIQYPLMLQVKHEMEIGQQIKSIKEQIRKVPKNGIGYGVLRYSNDFQESNFYDPWISFNYFGDMNDSEHFHNSKWCFEFEESGIFSLSENIEAGLLMEINAWETDKGIVFSFDYSNKNFSEEEVEIFINSFENYLIKIADHCSKMASSEKTASDYGFKKLTQNELEEIIQDYSKYEIQNLYPVTPLQEGFIYHALNNPEDDEYFTQTSFDLEGSYDIELYIQAWQRTVDEYDILRTAFDWNHTEFAQIVVKRMQLSVRRYDVSLEEHEEDALNAIRAEDAKDKFDLSKPCQTRLTIIERKHGKTHVILSQHHIIIDGWSFPILFDQVKKNYMMMRGIEQTQAIYQYGDYILSAIKGEYLEKDIKYWSKELEKFDFTPLTFMLSKNNYLKETKRNDKKRIYIDLSKESTGAIKKLAKETQITISDVLLTAWFRILSAYNNTDTIITGVTVSGREADIEGIQDMIGLFINTLPIFMNLEGLTVKETLQEIHNKIREINDHSMIGLSELQQMAKQNTPIINTLYIFENYPNEHEDFDYAIKNVNTYENVNYPFSIAAYEEDSHISLFVEYDNTVIDENIIKNMDGHIKNVIYGICKDAEAYLSEIDLMGDEEKETLNLLNNTATEGFDSLTFHGQFQKIAHLYPEMPAVIFNPDYWVAGEKQQCFTYKELDDITDTFARLMILNGLKKGDIVPILVNRSADIVVAAIAIMKAGGAYLPIDTEYPVERIRFMLEDCGAAMICIQPETKSLVDNCNIRLIDITEKPINIVACSLPECRKNDLCYVIYTSGSTGKPKGVMISHGALLNLSYSQYSELKMSVGSRICEHVSFAFDTSLYTLLVPLNYGATVYVLNESLRLDIEQIDAYITENKIDLIDLPTQLCLQFYEEFDNKQLKYLITGGEVLVVDTKPRSYKLVNEYGPTEYTVSATRYIVDKEQGSVPIGRPLQNTKIYIVDRNGCLCPMGIVGELCISGKQISNGYLNRDELTKEKFVKNNFCSDPEYALLYKTGDLAKWREDGNIEFLGRIDYQVKIRGYRVELEEVEKVLLSHTEIKSAAVVSYAAKDGTNYLAGFYVAEDKQKNGE